MLKVHDILKSNCLYETDHGRNFVRKFGKKCILLLKVTTSDQYSKFYEYLLLRLERWLSG